MCTYINVEGVAIVNALDKQLLAQSTSSTGVDGVVVKPSFRGASLNVLRHILIVLSCLEGVVRSPIRRFDDITCMHTETSHQAHG